MNKLIILIFGATIYSQIDITTKEFNFYKEKLNNSYYISQYGLYLPSFLKLKNNQIDQICKIINHVIK